MTTATAAISRTEKTVPGELSAGLDLGSRQARAVGLARTTDGKVILHGAAWLDLADDTEADGDLRSFCNRVGRPLRGVHCNLGPVGVITHQVEFPQMDPEEVRSAAEIEAAQLIPDLANMVLDVQILGVRTDVEQRRRDMTVLIVAAPKGAVYERRDLLFGANLEVLSIVPDGIALANAALALHTPEEGVVVVMDVDADGTILVAVAPEEEAVAPMVRYIPGGVSLLAPEDASPACREALSRTSVASGGDERGLHVRRERWLREVERSMTFISGKVRARGRHILVVGDGAGSPEFVDWLGQNLLVQAFAWNPLKELSRGADAPGDGFVEEHGYHSAIAVGLALTGGE